MHEKTDEDLRRLLTLMFEPGETVCSSPNVYATEPKAQSEVSTNDTFLTINPVVGGRKTENVTSFRTFLLEIDPTGWDNMTDRERAFELESQRKRLSEIPHSAYVYSGNKSLHFLIVLDKPLVVTEYKFYARWIKSAVKDLDPCASSPVVSVRVPGHLRKDTGNYQGLGDIKGRISKNELHDWLESCPWAVNPKNHQARNYLDVSPVNEGDRGQLSQRTQKFIMEGTTLEGWHRDFTLAVKDFKAQNYSMEETLEHLECVTGHLDEKDLYQIRYGFENDDWEMSFRPKIEVKKTEELYEEVFDAEEN